MFVDFGLRGFTEELHSLRKENIVADFLIFDLALEFVRRVWLVAGAELFLLADDIDLTDRPI